MTRGDLEAQLQRLRSQHQSVRKAATEALAVSTNPVASSLVVELLDDPNGYVVEGALEVLCARADPSTADALRRFVKSDNRFSLVWLARYAISAIQGSSPARVPIRADRESTYGVQHLFESLTWRHRHRDDHPINHGDIVAVVICPSFLPELMITVSQKDVRAWITEHSTWDAIQGDEELPAGAISIVLSEDQAVVDRFVQLINQGFDAEPGNTTLDGVSFGGFRFGSGGRTELPLHRETPVLLELLAEVRALGMSTSQAFLDFERFEALNVHLDVPPETWTIDTPLRAVRIVGRFDADAWTNLQSVTGSETFQVVDVCALRFLAPEIREPFRDWLVQANAVLIVDPANPHTRFDDLSSPECDSWYDARAFLAERPTLHEVGFWRATPGDGLPDPALLVDPIFDAGRSTTVANQLADGVPYVYFMGLSPCRICGNSNGAAQLTDGRFVWPEGLSHYVRDHHVVLPNEVTSALATALPKGGARWLLGCAVEACDTSDAMWRRVMRGASDL